MKTEAEIRKYLERLKEDRSDLEIKVKRNPEFELVLEAVRARIYAIAWVLGE